MKTPKTITLGKASQTGRGFPLVEFTDKYDHECSLQISSACVIEDDDGKVADPCGYIWLGINDAKPQIMKSNAKAHGLELPPGEVSGWMPYPVPEDVLMTTRMHFNEHQVRGLIKRLQYWLDHQGGGFGR